MLKKRFWEIWSCKLCDPALAPPKTTYVAVVNHLRMVYVPLARELSFNSGSSDKDARI